MRDELPVYEVQEIVIDEDMLVLGADEEWYLLRGSKSQAGESQPPAAAA